MSMKLTELIEGNGSLTKRWKALVYIPETPFAMLIAEINLAAGNLMKFAADIPELGMPRHNIPFW